MRKLLPYALPFLLLSGIVASSSGEELGMERVLTNAHVSIWIPSHTAHIWDDRATDVGVYETTPPGARFISGAVFHEYKIDAFITVMTEQEYKEHIRLFKDDDMEQEHPTLSMFDRPIGKCLRKDIRDTERNRLIHISVNVLKTNIVTQRETGTFQEDIETAKRMVESIRLLKVRADDTDFLNPLTVAEVERVKEEIGHLQPYMTPKDCVVALGLPLGKLKGSDSGPGKTRSISLQLREGCILLLACDGRGYVVAAQLDDKKWELKRKPEPSKN
jgi:hypothetical protein